MKTTIALLFIVVAVLHANGQASLSPSPPVIPETFSTQVNGYIYIYTATESLTLLNFVL